MPFITHLVHQLLRSQDKDNADEDDDDQSRVESTNNNDIPSKLRPTVRGLVVGKTTIR